MKLKLITALGILFLVIGVGLYIFPLFFDLLGAQSGLVAFLLIFIGISLLKVRKDQVSQ